MLATGMGGRSSRGPAFSASPFGMGGGGGGGMDFKNVAGLGALGYLAYKAFQERQQNIGAQDAGSSSGTGGGIFGGLFGGGQGGGGQVGGGLGGPAQGQPGGGGSLSDRLSSIFSSQQRETPETSAYPDVAMEDQRALLLIRAMIAAANADGEISPEERQNITRKLDEAGAGEDERRLVERELASPMSTDALVREVHDEQTAEQVYLASALAIEPDTEAERSYLQYLAARLKLDPQRAQELHRVA